MATFSMFGDIKRINRSPHLDGESYTVIFGDLKIDFTRTPLAEGDHHMSIVSLFGNAKLRFPEDVGIDVDGFVVFGETEIEQRSTGDEEQVGSSYQTDNFEAARTRVYIRVISMFGDIQIIRVPVSSGAPPRTEQSQLEDRQVARVYDGETRRIEHSE